MRTMRLDKEGKSEKEKMLAGELYDGSDPELVAEREQAAALSQA